MLVSNLSLFCIFCAIFKLFILQSELLLILHYIENVSIDRKFLQICLSCYADIKDAKTSLNVCLLGRESQVFPKTRINTVNELEGAVLEKYCSCTFAFINPRSDRRPMLFGLVSQNYHKEFFGIRTNKCSGKYIFWKVSFRA